MTDEMDVKKDAVQHIDYVGIDSPQAPKRSTIQEIWSNKRVMLWCLLIFLLPVNFGYEVAMIGKLYAAPAFQKQFGEQVDGKWAVKATDQQILNAGSTIGLFASAFVTGYLSDLFGRRKVVLIACLICIAGIMVQYFSTSVRMLFGGKVVSCFGFGLGHSLGPVWVAELAPQSIRGLCLALINTMIVLGQWFSSLCVYAASFRNGELAWRMPLITQLIMPGLLLVIGVPFLPESPAWLVMQDRHDDAIKALKRFNGNDYDAASALKSIRIAIDMESENKIQQKNASWMECFQQPNLRRTIIICMVYLSQQFIGVNFVSGYLTYYFSLAGVNNPLGIGQAAFAIQLFGNICSWPLIERLGRRPMLVYGCIIMTAGLLLIGCINIHPNALSLKVTVAFMCLWGWVYQATLGAVSYAVGGETPSPRLRQKTYAINIMTSTAVSCMITQIMPYLINPDQANLGGKVTFVFFAPSLPMCIYLFFFLPEMKGRSVAEIEEMFTERVPARKFKSYECRTAVAESKIVRQV